MFGGVNLFGGEGGGTGIKDTVPATTAAPSVEEKQENVTTTAPVETKRSFGGNKSMYTLFVTYACMYVAKYCIVCSYVSLYTNLNGFT